jgi:carboxymethylenebutenolidase
MCFDVDSHPPIVPIAGGASDSARLILTADDGAQIAAFQARATHPTGAGIIVLPDVRGLHPYFEELALRFAEHGVDALAIDYFGRTAGVEPRADGFEYMPHVSRTTWAGIGADVRAAAAALRSPADRSVQSLFTIGFCMGGRMSFLAGTLGLELAGVIGFYGWPTGPWRTDAPAPAAVAGAMAAPVLAVFGGADQGIPASARDEFETSLKQAGVDHRIVTYPGAPHGFFDRKSAEHGAASEAAWDETLSFIRARTAGQGAG